MHVISKKVLVTVSIGITIAVASSAHAMGVMPPASRDPATPAAPAPVATPRPAPVATPRPAPVAIPSPVSSSTGFTPLWIGKNKDAPNWTIYATEALETYGANLLKGTSDIDSFCPMYSRLGRQDQINFWIELLAGVAEYESGFNPTSHMVETTMGKDPITGSQVISAGLFQLSYQDTPNYRPLLPSGVCVFDYKSDSALAMTDIHRTINDPKNNITCAVAIMNYSVGHHHQIGFNSGNYWSTLMPASRYGKVPQIKALTKKLSFCSN